MSMIPDGEGGFRDHAGNPYADIETVNGIPVDIETRLGGILANAWDARWIFMFDEFMGLRELRAKVCGKAGITTEHLPLRLSSFAENCMGSRAIEITRKFLDSGALLQYYTKQVQRQGSIWPWNMDRVFCLLGCAFSLGCTLPEQMREKAEVLLRPEFAAFFRKVDRGSLLDSISMRQLKEAFDSYTPGVPYDFGNETATVKEYKMRYPDSDIQVETHGCVKLVKVTKEGKTTHRFIEPPTDVEIGKNSYYNLDLATIYPTHLCAACGKAVKDDGGELDTCSGCKDRKYCGRACQKKHWKAHKFICTYPKEAMKKFLNSIPLDFAGDVDSMEEAKKHV